MAPQIFPFRDVEAGCSKLILSKTSVLACACRVMCDGASSDMSVAVQSPVSSFDVLMTNQEE